MLTIHIGFESSFRIQGDGGTARQSSGRRANKGWEQRKFRVRVRHSDYIDACSLLAFSYKYTLTPATLGRVHAVWAL
jgi:hypothetical protein